MRLNELRRSGGQIARYVGTLADVTGARQYEITISGPRRLAEKVFAKSDFDIVIDPRVESGEDAEALSRKLWEQYATGDVPASPAESIDSLRKSLPKAASSTTSLVVALRRTEGKGTFWGAYFPVLALPRGVSLFFVLPPICHCFGAVSPQIGDADLFLTLGGAFSPVVAASARAGTAADSVAFGPAFCWPWRRVMPWFRVFGFSNSTTGFLMGGFGIP